MDDETREMRAVTDEDLEAERRRAPERRIEQTEAVLDSVLGLQRLGSPEIQDVYRLAEALVALKAAYPPEPSPPVVVGLDPEIAGQLVWQVAGEFGLSTEDSDALRGLFEAKVAEESQ